MTALALALLLTAAPDPDALFGSGFGPLRFGMSPAQAAQVLGLPAPAALERAPEYDLDVRYLWTPMTGKAALPGVQAAKEGYLCLFFFEGALVRISLRLDNVEGPTRPAAQAALEAFARSRGLDLKPLEGGRGFFAAGAKVLAFGLPSREAGCINSGPCVELIRSGSPAWRGQRFR